MENHESHPEIREALSGVPGFSHRRSITVREDMRYAALPVEHEGTVIGAVRTAIPASMLDSRLRQIMAVIGVTGLAALAIILGAAAFLARRITGPLAQMKEAAREMGSGNLSRNLQIRTGDEFEDMANAMTGWVAASAAIGQLDAEKARLTTLLASLSDGVIVVAPDRTSDDERRRRKAPRRVRTMAEGRPYPRRYAPPDPAVHRRWVKGEGAGTRDGHGPVARGERTIRVPAPGSIQRAYVGGRVTDAAGRTEERGCRGKETSSPTPPRAADSLRTSGVPRNVQDALRHGNRPTRSSSTPSMPTPSGWSG
jgi:HAMP domain-containing protein